MDQSPFWEAKWFSASQEIPRIVCISKVHYSIHKCPKPVPVLSQINLFHTPHPTSWRCLNIVFPSTSGSPKWHLSLRFPHQNSVYASPLPHTHYMPRPSYSYRFYQPNNNGWEIQIINPLTPNDSYRGRTAPLTPKSCILYIYSTNIGNEYFKHGIYSPFF